MVADIEKAFLQIRLLDDARDITRFLWLKDRDKLEVENNIQRYRFYRVPFWVISSPFVLAATIDHHLTNCNTDVSETIRKNIYVENVITGTQSCQEAVHLYNVYKQVFKKLRARVGRPQTSLTSSNLIAGCPKAALLFWFFGGFRCGVPLFIVMLVIY